MNEEEVLLEEEACAGTAVITPESTNRGMFRKLNVDEPQFRLGGEQELASLKEIERALERKGFMFENKEADANKQVERLQKKYGVKVEVIESDSLYCSDATLERTIRESTYFISQENPEKTAEKTEYLIRYAQLKIKLMNADRSERATQKALGVGEHIKRIESNYKDEHGGSSPSLRTIASILNDKNIESPSGKSDWKATTVKRVIEKMGKAR